MLWLLLACFPSVKDPGTSSSSTSTTDSPTGGDSSTTTDSTSSSTAVLEGITLSASSTSVTSRDPLTFTVSGHYNDGSEKDLTGSATFSSSAPKIIRLNGSNGVILAVGTSEITASKEGLEDKVEVEVTALATPRPGEIVINEMMADATGDPNNDGVEDAVDDEFVELANLAGITFDLSGLTLTETGQPDKPRHRFAAGSVLQPEDARVIFGGGTPTGFAMPHCTAEAAINDDNGLQLGLALNNDGDTLRVSGMQRVNC